VPRDAPPPGLGGGEAWAGVFGRAAGWRFPSRLEGSCRIDGRSRRNGGIPGVRRRANSNGVTGVPLPRTATRETSRWRSGPSTGAEGRPVPVATAAMSPGGRGYVADPPSDRRLERGMASGPLGFLAPTIVRTLVCGGLSAGPSAFLLFAPTARSTRREPPGRAGPLRRRLDRGARPLPGDDSTRPAPACGAAGARSGDTVRVCRSPIPVWLTGLPAISRGVAPVDFRRSLLTR